MSDKWSTGLCGCFSDCETCMHACCLPGAMLGSQNKIIHQGSFFSIGCCLYSAVGASPIGTLIPGCCCIGPNQTALKEKLGITQSDCLGDACCSVVCQSCVMARMGRELKARGIYTMEQLSGQLPSTLAPSNMTMIKAA